MKDEQASAGDRDLRLQCDSPATLELLASKEKELGQIQKALENRTSEMEAAREENYAKEAMLRDQNISMSSLEEVNKSLADQLAAQEERVSALGAELEGSRLENASLKKKLDNFNLKIDTVRSLEADFDSLNQDFTKVK